MRHSSTNQRNPLVQDWTDSYQSRDNLAFFKDALAELSAPRGAKGHRNRGVVVIGLLGQRDLPGYTLRTAQAVLRWDLRPSLWSHAFLVCVTPEDAGPDTGKIPILEVTLHPRTGKFPAAERNGVMEGSLDLYRDPNVDANGALLGVEMDSREMGQVLARARDFNADRIRYNFWLTLGIWQGYLWSQGDRPNPLREGVPVFSSSYVEMAFEAIRLDLTPGASERNSAPEHLWNAAVWWHNYYRDEGHPIRGVCVLRDKGCSMLDSSAATGPAARSARKPLRRR